MFRLPLPPDRLIVAVARNQAHRLLGGARRGGHRWSLRPSEESEAHTQETYDLLSPYVGDVQGRIGLEIGPGDHLGVCRRFLDAGAARLYAAEKYAAGVIAPPGVVLIHATIEELTLPEPIDFAVSNDVFEHVRDVGAAFARVFSMLRPGGVFVSSVDLRGHNCFSNHSRPLDFLACPDRLWPWLFSHIETTNRVRFSDLTRAAEAAGFIVEVAEVLVSADPAYLAEARPRFLPRYRNLADADLSALQVLIAARRPPAEMQQA